MSKTKIIMHGCNGAMGQVISRLAAQSDSVEIVAGLDIADKGLYEYPVFVNPVDCQVEADVIVDFSVAKAVDGLLTFALERKLPLVLCTTGLSEAQLKRVGEVSETIPVLKSANMSLESTLYLNLWQRRQKSLPTAATILRLWKSTTIRNWTLPPGLHWRLPML